MLEIIGNSGEKVLIEINGRLYPQSSDEWDMDFLEATMKADIPGFKVFFSFTILSREMKFWSMQLQEFISLTKKHIALNTIEEHVGLNLEMGELGNVLWVMRLKYPVDSKNVLTVFFENSLGDVISFSNQLRYLLNQLPS